MNIEVQFNPNSIILTKKSIEKKSPPVLPYIKYDFSLPLSYYANLNILITKPLLRCTHNSLIIILFFFRAQFSQINQIVQLTFGQKWPIQIRECTIEIVLSNGQCGVLPESLEAINLCVMKKENWVAEG